MCLRQDLERTPSIRQEPTARMPGFALRAQGCSSWAVIIRYAGAFDQAHCNEFVAAKVRNSMQENIFPIDQAGTI
jgi:hypothetical protein